MADDQRRVRLRIICYNPPASVYFGVQDKDQQLHAGTPQADGSILFEFEVPVKRSDDGKPNFLGTFAHGTPADRFVYLTVKDGAEQIVRRIKVKLGSITWEQIEGNGVIEAAVDGGRSGSVPLLGDGWQVLK
jgi:hypothetical protein